ncbi:MAG: SDR family NAD(P)-dependent oxidoreductase [Bacteroidales bacterium]|nr:SDR family NAD(P)-dependent oxidoreductase [Bacteroidales bacterium]MDD4671058.1 SDR family NAD(P)-dependent oxidoreductase [Bacteroidales bacterium]
MNNRFFKGKTALVTGAGSGIGEAIAKQLAQRGTNVIISGLDIKALDRVRQTCEDYGVKAWSFEFDLSNTDSIDTLVDFINNNGIRPDIFVFNAGVSQRALTLESDFSVDRKLMDINFFGSVYITKRFKELLISAQCTYIAVNTSISGLFGFPLRSAYCASKHALFGFFESLELENRNIKVTFIIPGRVNTQISKSAITANGEAYAKMDAGQANGMDVDKCARQAVMAIAKGKHKRLIGGKELLMAYFYKYTPCIFYKLARKVSAT